MVWSQTCNISEPVLFPIFEDENIEVNVPKVTEAKEETEVKCH